MGRRTAATNSLATPCRFRSLRPRSYSPTPTAFLEQVRQRRETERQARLTTYDSREEPAAGQVERYVQAEAGLGLRHQRLYGADCLAAR
jgi:hypothetical protein